MQVNIRYSDNVSLSVEEIVKLAQQTYGKNAEVEVTPDSFKAHDLIYFGIQQMITHEQLGILFDDADSYQKDITKLRAEILYKVEEIVNQVIIDNESKVAP